MKRLKCNKCGKTRLVKFFSVDTTRKSGYQRCCKTCNSANNAQFRHKNRDYQKQYNKSKHGFLIKKYLNIQHRVSNPYNTQYHGLGVPLREEFMEWSLNHPDFKKLFRGWVQSGYNRSLTPIIRRIFVHTGYELFNLEWVPANEIHNLNY